MSAIDDSRYEFLSFTTKQGVKPLCQHNSASHTFSLHSSVKSPPLSRSRSTQSLHACDL